MKRKTLVSVLLVVLCVCLTITLGSCMKEEDYYTKSNVDSIIAELEAALTEKDAENEAALNALKAEYGEKIAELEGGISDNKNAIAGLTTEYNAKVAELEAADKATNDALAALAEQYAKDLEALKVVDSENEAAIEALNKTYTDKVAELEAADKATNEALATLRSEYEAEIEALKVADGENKAAIEALNKTYTDKVAELEAADKATNDALATLAEQYAKDLEALNKADENNAAAIEALNKTYTDKVTELEAADKATNDALATLRSEYEAKVIELNEKIAANEAQIASCKAELQASINALTSKHDSEIANVNILITALKNVDEENAAQIAELQAQANYLLAKFTVKFDVNGGNETIASQTVTRGEKATKPTDPTRDGYVFLGWYVGDEKWSFVGYTVTEDITLTAKWVSNKILSVKENCTLSESSLTIKVSGEKDYVDVLDKITYDTSCTASLFSDSALTNEYAYCRMTGLTVGENKAYLLIKYTDSYFKVYEVTVYITVDFISDGAIFEQVELDSDSQVVAPTLTPTSVNNGYEFSHWAVNAEKVTFPYTVFPDTVFEAVYVPITYTLTYNANGGVMPTEYTTTYTVESGASLPTPTRSLYLFEGWFSSYDFSGSAIKNISVGEYGNKTLYAKWKSATNGVTLTLSGDRTYYTVNGYEGADTAVVIPQTVEGIPVTQIASSAFKNKQKITSVIIPDSVTDIGSSAFEGCTSLTSITISDSVTIIGNEAFYGCRSLTSVTIPDSVTIIDQYAFADCTSLTSITIPDSVTSIGDGAFYYCGSLTSITIPDSVTSIGSYAFYYCDSLTSITIPNSVTSIGSDAFSDCTSLTSITIPDSVTSIGGFAFHACESITSLTIGKGVTCIGYAAFYNCTSLTSVTIPDSVTSIGDYAFYDCSSLKIIMFEGTVAQWNEITKGEDWAYNVPATKVTCSDGTVDI